MEIRSSYAQRALTVVGNYSNSLTVNYMFDIESNILSIEITKGKIDHAKEFGNFIVHLSRAGKPILIEILDASKFIGKFDIIKELKDIKKLIPS